MVYSNCDLLQASSLEFNHLHLHPVSSVGSLHSGYSARELASVLKHVVYIIEILSFIMVQQ